MTVSGFQRPRNMFQHHTFSSPLGFLLSVKNYIFYLLVWGEYVNLRTYVKVSQKTACGNAVSPCIAWLLGLRLDSRLFTYLSYWPRFLLWFMHSRAFICTVFFKCFYYSPSHTHLFLFYDKINIFNKWRDIYFMIKRSFLCIFQLLNTILFFLWFPYIWFCSSSSLPRSVFNSIFTVYYFYCILFFVFLSYKIYILYLRTHVLIHTWHTCGGHNSLQQSVHPMWVLGVKLRSSGLDASVFPHWAILTALKYSWCSLPLYLSKSVLNLCIIKKSLFSPPPISCPLVL